MEAETVTQARGRSGARGITQERAKSGEQGVISMIQAETVLYIHTLYLARIDNATQPASSL